MERCRTHWERLADAPCSRCGGLFCRGCLVSSAGRFFCTSCRPAAAVPSASQRTVARTPTASSKADTALALACIGIFFFGFILGPIAISQALKALAETRLAPGLPGAGKAKWAIAIASFSLAVVAAQVAIMAYSVVASLR